MPTIWRYLLAQYLQVLTFCCITFLLLLLTLRLEEIAHFATLGAGGLHVVRFVGYQIPYMLPIALPISALIAAVILFRSLSKQHELTAMRAAGFSLPALMTPLLIAASFLCIVNFYFVSELATSSHLSASQIKNEFRNVNPLLLLNNKHLMKLKGVYVDTLGPSRLGESASQIIVAMPNRVNQRINLLLAEQIRVTPTDFYAKGLTLLTSLEEKNSEDCPDRLFVENIASTSISAGDFSQMVQTKITNVNNDHLRLQLLQVRLRELQAADAAAVANRDENKSIDRQIKRVYTEIMRRLSVALAPFSFTLMGCCCGVNISRRHSMRGIAILIILSALYLAAYFSAHSVDQKLIPALALYTAPHILIIATSLWVLRRITRGEE